MQPISLGDRIKLRGKTKVRYSSQSPQVSRFGANYLPRRFTGKKEGGFGTSHLVREAPEGDFWIITLRSSTHLHRAKIIGYIELYFAS